MTVTLTEPANNLWRTPKGDSPIDSYWTLNKLISQFDLRLDPCCTGPEDAMCENYFTPKEDGLKQDWKHNTIFNPPFSKIKRFPDGTIRTNEDDIVMYESCIGDWCKKAIVESQKNKILVIGILPLYGSSNWFQEYIWNRIPKDNVYILDKRIQYLDSTNTPIRGNRFDSFLAFWDQRK